MSTYFKDHVQEIKNNYPHPVEPFILLSREGHHDAAIGLLVILQRNIDKVLIKYFLTLFQAKNMDLIGKMKNRLKKIYVKNFQINLAAFILLL